VSQGVQHSCFLTDTDGCLYLALPSLLCFPSPSLPCPSLAPLQVLACLAFTSLCVTALLLGRRSNETVGRIMAGVVAAACMLPCRMLLPSLYKAANAPLKAPVVWSWPRPKSLSGRRRPVSAPSPS
jgi:hypothetical protein